MSLIFYLKVAYNQLHSLKVTNNLVSILENALIFFSEIHSTKF